MKHPQHSGGPSVPVQSDDPARIPSPSRRRLLAGTGALAMLGTGLPAFAQSEKTALARIRDRGALTVAVYRDFPPFHFEGKGIDVDIAQAVAAKLGVRLQLMPFDEGEDVNDDLRNMVWRGHYLGYGPADVMIHVPVDRVVMQANDRALIFAPYYRESVWLAHDVARVPRVEGLASLAGVRVGVDGTSIAALMMLSAEGGRFRDQLAVFRHPREAIAALRRGEVAAVMALRSELQSELSGDARFALAPAPLAGPVAAGWALGFAVRREAEDLARAVQEAVNGLRASGELAGFFRSHRVEPVVV